MLIRLVALFVALLSIGATAFPQVPACNSIQDNWKYYYDASTYALTRTGSGQITGTYAVTLFCPGMTFPITGTITGDSFTISVTGLNACPGGGAQWLTYTGFLGQPGCNFAYGNWSNSLNYCGGFRQDNAYPPIGVSTIFTKPVDVPTSETTATPTGAQWDTNSGARWNQTLVPNTPSGEFEGYAIYEYATGQGTDTCWFAGSSVAKFDAITTPGFAWNVTSHNTWGADFIGWNLAAVRYYRTKKRVPCSSSFQQQIVIDCAYAPANPSTYTGPFTTSRATRFTVCLTRLIRLEQASRREKQPVCATRTLLLIRRGDDGVSHMLNLFRLMVICSYLATLALAQETVSVSSHPADLSRPLSTVVSQIRRQTNCLSPTKILDTLAQRTSKRLRLASPKRQSKRRVQGRALLFPRAIKSPSYTLRLK